LVQILSGSDAESSEDPETFRRLQKLMERWKAASPSFRTTDKPCLNFEKVLSYCYHPKIAELKVESPGSSVVHVSYISPEKQYSADQLTPFAGISKRNPIPATCATVC
jgi:hypothetical protein